MCPTDKIQVMSVQEFTDDVGSEGEADTSVVFSPTVDVFVRIGPQQVAQQTCVWHVCRPHDAPDLLHTLQVWAQASVATEDLLVDDGCDRQTVETVCECLPQFDVVSSFTYMKTRLNQF
jgi:hypothetical protein